MDQILRKFATKYKRAKEELDKWESLQERLLVYLANMSAILERLPMIVEVKNFGVLQNIQDMDIDLSAKQVESFENIFVAVHDKLEEFRKIRDSLERLWRESLQIVKAEKVEPKSKQAKKRFGVGPSLSECINGLEDLFVMHRDEFQLKIDAIKCITYNTSAADMVAIQHLLTDQPNIPKDEVQFIFDYFYAGYSV